MPTVSIRKMVPPKKKNGSLKDMGKLVQVAGWMSQDEKDDFMKALAKHSFIDGQSDFINKTAEALISQSKPGKPAIAQPLCFLTVEDRDLLAAIKLKNKVSDK